MKRLFLPLVCLLGVWLGVVLWYWDSEPPSLEWTAPAQVGKDATLRIRVTDSGRGLKEVKVALIRDGQSHEVFSTRFPRSWLPWGSGPAEQEVVLQSTEKGIAGIPLSDGEFTVEVLAVDQANLLISQRTLTESRVFQYDTRPPQIEVLSRQHYIRQGGSEAVLYRVAEPGGTSGVQVGEKTYFGFPVPGDTKGTNICIFALGHDQPTDSAIRLWAEDEAGNRGTTGFWLKTFKETFRSRNISISDELIAAVTPEILSYTEEVSEQPSPVETFVEINSRLRKINHQKIEEITADSAPRLLWSRPFLQLSNSQVEASFADHRTYFYQGKQIDRQTHLGFDLASLAHSTVEAANDGVVTFAGYLGIYGNCVILDHGLGLFSLYGHLSSMEVEKGQSVSRGQSLGRTGKTGLAAGDHLHFTMLVQGTQVNPLEWWDDKWAREHLLDRLTLEE